MRWWHRYVLKHTIESKKVSVPLWDWGSKGFLYKCSCGEMWAE